MLLKLKDYLCFLMLAYGENGSENAFIFEIKNKFHENAEELK